MIWTQIVTREFAIQSSVSESLTFRVDVFEGIGESGARQFKLRVWRYETFRLLPLSRVAGGKMFDHTCLVLDDMFDGLEVTAASPEEAADICRSRLLEQLVPSRRSREKQD